MHAVIGFLEGSFSGVEQRQPYVVQIGYQKGAEIARQDFEFDVGYIEDTASEYAINITLARN